MLRALSEFFVQYCDNLSSFLMPNFWALFHFCSEQWSPTISYIVPTIWKIALSYGNKMFAAGLLSQLCDMGSAYQMFFSPAHPKYAWLTWSGKKKIPNPSTTFTQQQNYFPLWLGAVSCANRVVPGDYILINDCKSSIKMHKLPARVTSTWIIESNVSQSNLVQLNVIMNVWWS